MSEHRVSLHLIEPGSRGADALVEIAMVLTDDEMESLSQFDADTWRSTISRAQCPSAITFTIASAATAACSGRAGAAPS